MVTRIKPWEAMPTSTRAMYAMLGVTGDFRKH
jgi:hypothetical protein